MKRRLAKRTAREAWLLIGFVVVGWEVWCPPGQLLSEYLDECVERWPVRTRVAVLLVALHLVNWLPARFDPLHQLARLGRKA